MSETYESILEAARRLPPEQQRLLAERLLNVLSQTQTRSAKGSGKARRYFGVWDSGDERSADNERIDRDLAGEHENSR